MRRSMALLSLGGDQDVIARGAVGTSRRTCKIAVGPKTRLNGAASAKRSFAFCASQLRVGRRADLTRQQRSRVHKPLTCASLAVMLSRISSRVFASSSTWVRQLSASSSVLEGELASNSEFASKVAAFTNTEPSFPKDFLKNTEVGPSDGPTPSKIKLSFVAPHKILMKDLEVRRPPALPRSCIRACGVCTQPASTRSAFWPCAYLHARHSRCARRARLTKSPKSDFHELD